MESPRVSLDGIQEYEHHPEGYMSTMHSGSNIEETSYAGGVQTPVQMYVLAALDHEEQGPECYYG